MLCSETTNPKSTSHVSQKTMEDYDNLKRRTIQTYSIDIFEFTEYGIYSQIIRYCGIDCKASNKDHTEFTPCTSILHNVLFPNDEEPNRTETILGKHIT